MNKETKDIITGDVFDNFLGKKLIGTLLMMIIIFVVASADSVPFWVVVLGICAPAYTFWRLKIWQAFENCKFLEED